MARADPIEDLAARTSLPGEVRFVRLATAAMGTRFELVILGENERLARAAGEEAIEEIGLLHRRLSAFERSSELARVNREAGLGWTPISADLEELLGLCARAHGASGGAFDPTIGPLMVAWGMRGGPVDEDAARAAVDRVGMDKVEIADGRVRFAHPELRLDLGGVAKGFALDRAGRILREAGIETALLHGGTSSAIAVGAPGEAGWRIRIGSDGPVVALRDAALGVSASHGREVEHGGERLGHVIDPRVGAPTMGALRSMSIGPSAAWCDAMSTALLAGQQWTGAMLGELALAAVERERGEWSCAPGDGGGESTIEWPDSGRSTDR